MVPKMAEHFVAFGYEDHRVKICLAPDVVLILFLDGSAVLENHHLQIVYPDCWDKQGQQAFNSKSLCNN